uniref:Uncharacterized protein n=1 Tax=Candidatus Kentrum sp. SD TaxID=2126332 RepID=A0A450YTG2_9GAMM|nr:MAG: hypothetical protein BECKSD772F_GA0070984_11984 [Candidatus Kentron sp. SD]
MLIPKSSLILPSLWERIKAIHPTTSQALKPYPQEQSNPDPQATPYTKPHGNRLKQPYRHKRSKCFQNIYGLEKNAPHYKNLSPAKKTFLVFFYPNRHICISYNQIKATLKLSSKKGAIYHMADLKFLGYVEIRHKRYWKNGKLHGRNYYVLTKKGRELLDDILHEAWTGERVEFGRLPIIFKKYACLNRKAWRKYQAKPKEKRSKKKAVKEKTVNHKTNLNKFRKTCQDENANFSPEHEVEGGNSHVWSQKDFDSGALDGSTTNSEPNIANSQGYDYARLERLLDQAEAKKRERAKRKIPPAFKEIVDRHGFSRHLKLDGLSKGDVFRKAESIEILLGCWNEDPEKVEKILSKTRTKIDRGWRMGNFWAFTFYRLKSKFGTLEYFTMRTKEMRKALNGEKTRLDDGEDTKYIVDSIREKELRFGVQIKEYLINNCLRKPAHFVRVALDAVDYRLKLDGIKQHDPKHKKIENPFGLLGSILKMSSVEEIKAKFWGRKCAN